MPSLYFCVSCKQSIHITDSFSVDYEDFPFPLVVSLLLSADFFLPVFTPPSFESVELRMPPPLVLCGGSPKKFAFLGRLRFPREYVSVRKNAIFERK